MCIRDRPQTIESINHAKAANVKLIVAMNKMDKPTANPERVMEGLTKYGIITEDWGGDVACIPVSALTGMGINDLLERIALEAEVMELKANPNRRAKGAVVEARLDKGQGPIATILVQNGTLHSGDVIIAGTAVGRVRTMRNDKGQLLSDAGPSTPVEITGLTAVPEAGDLFEAVEDERLARELVEHRKLDALRLIYGSVPDTLSQLIRTAFIAPDGHVLIDADFSAIEARVISWLAGEQWRLEVFRTHGKIYEASASQMFGVPIELIKKGNPEYSLRQKGKVAELALGYQGSTGALINLSLIHI